MTDQTYRKRATSPTESDAKPKKKSNLSAQQRKVLFFAKAIGIPLALLSLFFIGMAAGYKYGGGSAGEVFDAETWRNIILIIFG
ncbi:hypothetical protein BHU72_05080 [Desulfuribacillus stibiiarsenatis]|uniref:DNA-directed RNA polymerase subunit beta n=1 Tax=Desulfuribacillus stibiiarsenatis TaxID=1390249 RepID=A0A1E5L5R1_9FIRM|nr:DNA-directed RNA polymerase subunit beta [Desulfuribacillus stibiiarsenatis]OEH85461.1 hypothetical protein BHU72_05080 [Desulfuribacillus stibiiarsenatis]